MAIYDRIDVSYCDLQAVIKTSNQIEIQNICFILSNTKCHVATRNFNEINCGKKCFQKFERFRAHFVRACMKFFEHLNYLACQEMENKPSTKYNQIVIEMMSDVY